MTRRLLDNRNLSILVILVLFLVMFGAGSVAFTGFFSLQNFLNLFIDNAYLLILAVGMTFVIISGGIELSGGSMLGLATMISASLVQKSHLSPLLVIPIVLLIGAEINSEVDYAVHSNMPRGTADFRPFERERAQAAKPPSA